MEMRCWIHLKTSEITQEPWHIGLGSGLASELEQLKVGEMDRWERYERLPDLSDEQCPTCKGEGEYWADNGDGTGVPNAFCDDCEGTGLVKQDAKNDHR